MLFGLDQQKPRHFRDMFRIVWENRDQLPFAWRILRDGVCDGCALGTSGLKDWTLKGTHLCMVRLELMRLNTAPALDPSALHDVSTLASTTSAGLRALGRLPEPMLRRQGEAGFRRVSWDRGPRSPGRGPADGRSRAGRVLHDVAGHHQRGLLRGAEGRALPRHQPRRQRGAPVSRGVDDRHEGRARPRGVHLQLHRLARRRPDRVLRLQRRQQPAGHDQVPALRQAERRAGGGRQHLSRAGAEALLGAVDCVERRLRHGHRRPLVRRPHRRRSGVPRRRVARV